MWFRLVNALSVNYVRLICLAVGIAFLVGSANADDSTAHENQLTNIYKLSGVEAHLGWVLSTVQQESEQAHQNCESQDDIPDLQKTLNELLSLESLRASFKAELKERTTRDQRNEIIAWANSSAGQLIHKVEAESINIDQAQFEKLYAAYQTSDKNTDERNLRMRNMLADTGAVYFISAINTETSALVAMASVCSGSVDNIGAAEAVIRDERGAEPLYRSFMRQELILPSSVVYQSVSDADIDAYSEFAKSEAGNAYFSALIKGGRSVLAERVDTLKQSIQSID